jgi:hypothetical protein
MSKDNSSCLVQNSRSIMTQRHWIACGHSVISANNGSTKRYLVSCVTVSHSISLPQFLTSGNHFPTNRSTQSSFFTKTTLPEIESSRCFQALIKPLSKNFPNSTSFFPKLGCFLEGSLLRYPQPRYHSPSGAKPNPEPLALRSRGM